MKTYIAMNVVVAVIITVLTVQFMPSPAQPMTMPTTPTGAEGDCWDKIGNCIGEHVNNTMADPMFDPSSTSFNATEYLCCPLMQQAATTEKTCFCAITTFLELNPSFIGNFTLIFNTCDIASSISALNTFCQGP